MRTVFARNRRNEASSSNNYAVAGKRLIGYSPRSFAAGEANETLKAAGEILNLVSFDCLSLTSVDLFSQQASGSRPAIGSIIAHLLPIAN